MRIDKLKRLIEEKGHFPYMVNDLKNIAYLTGFEGSSAQLFVTETDSILVTDSRYGEYAQSVVRGALVEIQNGSPYDMLRSLTDRYSWKKLYIEESILLSQFNSIRKELITLDCISDEEYTLQLRLVKDKEEIEKIKKAVLLADSCLISIKSLLREGVSEADISAEIEYYFRKNGSTGSSFDTIVAFGSHSSMPHYHTGNSKLSFGDTVLIDTGCVVDGYCSDITRTFFFGETTAQMRSIYDIVNKARAAAVDGVKPGILSGILDRTARDIITENGFGEYFGHSLGHGVGRDVHEAPRVKNGSDEVLPEGSVITVEPGIYIPGTGGVRIEDMVLIGPSGPQILTTMERDLTIL